MKQKLIAWTRPILCACMAFSLLLGSDLPSLVILGEYAYPQNIDE